MSLLGSWRRLVGRRWRTGLLVFLLVTAAGVAVLFLSRPVYRAEALLRLGEPPPPGGVSPGGGVLSFLQPGGDPFANDLELLGSRSLAESVVAEVGLNVKLEAPAGWHRDSLLVSLEASRDTDDAFFRIRRQEGRLVVRREEPEDSTPGVVEPGARTRLGGVEIVFRYPPDGAPGSFGLRTIPFGEAVRVTRAALRVERPRREANVVALAYDHTDPDVARDVVASVVRTFVDQRITLQARESGETVDSIRRVAARTAEELARAEDALEEVQRHGRIVAPDAQSEALVERQTELLSNLQRARSELAGVNETLRRLEQSEDPGTAWTALLSYPTFLENETMGGLLTRLTLLHAEREALATRRVPENRELRLLDEQIEYLDASLRRIAREYRAGLGERIASLEPEVEVLDRMLEGLPARAVELGRRERDVRLLSEVLVLTEQRLRQEELREALTYSNVQVIDSPALRDRPIWPRKKLGLAVLLLLASGSSLLGMVVRERTDPRTRDAEDAEREAEAPLLATVSTGSPDVDRVLRAVGPGNGRLVVVPVGGEGAVALAAALGDAARREAGGRDVPVALTDTGPIRDRADAVGVASTGDPAALVVEPGRSTSAEIRRVATLIRNAGGRIAGVIVLEGTDGARSPE